MNVLIKSGGTMEVPNAWLDIQLIGNSIVLNRNLGVS